MELHLNLSAILIQYARSNQQTCLLCCWEIAIIYFSQLDWDLSFFALCFDFFSIFYRFFRNFGRFSRRFFGFPHHFFGLLTRFFRDLFAISPANWMMKRCLVRDNGITVFHALAGYHIDEKWRKIDEKWRQMTKNDEKWRKKSVGSSSIPFRHAGLFWKNSALPRKLFAGGERGGRGCEAFMGV